jgi:D-alanyl-D-alanine carboxypeptidase (penicillin-binding protein 5/6)
MLFHHRFFVFLAVFLCVFGLLHAEKKTTKKSTAIVYRSAIVIDADTGKTLREDRADDISPPASMTKLMTFAIVQDKIKAGALTLKTPITIKAADANMGGTQVWLKEGEVFTVEDLIYAMMIQSANDAAHALARTAGGSTESFVELMNQKAQKLGMKRTKFRTPHGLPTPSRKTSEGDLSTPRDFSLLCQYLLDYTDILKYTSAKNRSFGTGIRSTDRVVNMVNHNHLLRSVDGVDGFKTGYTRGAGYCLSATAVRNGRRLIVITMGSSDRKLRDKKITELIEWGFSHLPAIPVAKEVPVAVNKTTALPAKSNIKSAGQNTSTVKSSVKTSVIAKTLSK